MTRFREPTDDELRRMLGGLESATPPPRPEFEEELWAELSAAHPGLGDTPSSYPPLTLVRTDASSTQPSTQLDPGRSTKPAGSDASPKSPRPRFLAAAGLMVAAGLVGALMANYRTESARIEAAGGADDPSAEGDEADSIASVGFADSPTVIDIGVHTATVTFTSSNASAYNVSLRGGDRLITTQSASVSAGDRVAIVLEDLDSATQYAVDVTLVGPPLTQSGRIAFQTLADPNNPASFDEPIEILWVEHGTDDDADAITIETNVCAVAAYVLLDAVSQVEIARSEPTETCATTHTLHPSDFEVDLSESDSEALVVIAEVEQTIDGARNGNAMASSPIRLGQQ